MINRLLNIIDKSKTPFHFSEEMKKVLIQNGFKELNLSNKFDIQYGKYFIIKDGAIVVFRVDDINSGFNIVVSHTDSPALKIKSNPDIISNNYNLLNVEVYGGAILNTWYDKPLSIAGIIRYEEDDEIKDKLFDFNRPICTIPNLAIHMNREINNGVKIDKQKDLRPIISINDDSKYSDFLGLLSEESGVDKDKILSYEMTLYNTQKSEVFGIENEFIIAPRLDNLTMAISSIEGLILNNTKGGINMAVCLESEEIGSETLNGGNSSFLSNILERISYSLGLSREEHLIQIEKSIVISADLAHSIHPNFVEKSDVTNRPIINKGFVIKINSNKRYATDSKSEAIVTKIAKDNNIMYQKYFNNSNEVGGTSLGPIISANLSVRTIDIGNPILGMHSERETGGVKDYLSIIELFKHFYGAKNV